jgi:hypothetical protein
MFPLSCLTTRKGLGVSSPSNLSSYDFLKNLLDFLPFVYLMVYKNLFSGENFMDKMIAYCGLVCTDCPRRDFYGCV